MELCYTNYDKTSRILVFKSESGQNSRLRMAFGSQNMARVFGRKHRI